MKRLPIVSVDFDGVLHSYESGWRGAGTVKDGPVPGAMAWLVECVASNRVQIAIFSSRSKNPMGRWAMNQWLRKHLGAYLCSRESDEMVNLLCVQFSVDDYGEAIVHALIRQIMARITWPFFKPAAFLTLDDRAITFEGAWPTLETILDFKPWNKR